MNYLPGKLALAIHFTRTMLVPPGLARCWSLCSLLVLSMTGCVVGPDYQRPDLTSSLPREFAGAQAFAANASKEAMNHPADFGNIGESSGITNAEPQSQPANHLAAAWWQYFSDPALTALITQGLSHNLELDSANAMIRQAREQVTSIAGTNLPQLNTTTRISRDQLSHHNEGLANLPPSDSNPKTLFTDYRAGFDASWELDIAGHTARSHEAANARLESSQQQRRAVELRIAAEIAGNVIEYRALQLHLRNATFSLATSQQLYELFILQQQAGLLSSSELIPSRNAVFTARGALAPLRAAISSTVAALTVLTDLPREQVEHQLEYPLEYQAEHQTASAVATKIPMGPDRFPLGLPSELLQRRPDLRLAESQLAAASAEIGMAIADQYPRLSLTGNIGLETITPGNLTQQASRFWSFGPQLSLPLVSGGRLQAQIRIREAARDAAIANYRQAVLMALADTETALIRYQQEQWRLEQLRQSVATQQQQVDFAMQRFTLGDSSMTAVLEARLQLAQLMDQQQSAEQTVAINLLALFKALGGGFD